MQIHKHLPIPPKGGQRSKNIAIIQGMEPAVKVKDQWVGDAVDLDKKSKANSFRFSAKRIGETIKIRVIREKNGKPCEPFYRCWKMNSK